MGSINFKSLFWGYSTTLLLQSAYGTELSFGSEAFLSKSEFQSLLSQFFFG